MERLVRTQNHMVLKAFKKHWSLQLRSLKAIEEVQIKNVSNPQEWEFRTYVSHEDLTQQEVQKYVDDQSNYKRNLYE